MKAPLCECGSCRRCRQREHNRSWRERNPERAREADAAHARRQAADRERQARKRAEDREAYNAEARRRRAENPEHFRELDRLRGIRDRRKRADQKLRSAYGITLDDYEAMSERQGGVCAICGQPERAMHKNGAYRRLAVDHCHETGVVRGLLCSRCNPMIGYAQHDVAVLRQAIAYLDRTKP
jgi:hypothetical protein